METTAKKISIRMKGLGIAHFNHQTGLWEFLFLRGIDKHNLKLLITKNYANGQSSDAQIDIDEGVRHLEIITKNASSASGSDISAGSTFDFRYGQDSGSDSRWVVDLSELHGNLAQPADVKIAKINPNRNLTLLTVSDAIFHCAELSPHEYEFVEAQTGVPIARRNVGLWLGLDIDWRDETSTTEIRIDGSIVETLSPANGLTSVEIGVDNDCQSTNPKECFDIDFYYYYDELVKEKRIDQTGPFSASPGKLTERLLGRVDCHLVNVSKIADEHGKPIESLGELV